MSVINIARNALKSRTVRELIGERTIDIFAELSRPQQDENGGLLNFLPPWLRNFTLRLGGFLTGLVGRAIGWLWRNIWDIIIEATYTLVTFDFNQTDAAIRAQISQNNVQIAGALGDFAGTGLVWLASIGLASAAAIKFPVISGKVALALAQEGGEEIRGQLLNLLTVTRNAITSSFVLGTFLTLRRLRLFGFAPVTEQRQAWTIAGAVEERIESIDNALIRSFVENFVESATEAIIEAGYVVSYVLDDFYASQKLANENLLGEQRAVKIEPDNRNNNESLVMFGPQRLLQQSLLTTLGTHKLIFNRDVGHIVGQPAEDWLRAGVQRRKLTIVFKSRESPPWVVLNGERVKEVTYTIPEAKIGLTWTEIKTAARRFNWGKFRATANLENGRQIAVHGATANEAEDKIRELLQLSTLNLLTLSVTEEKDRNPNLRKSPTIMYPAYATLLIRRSTAELTGNTDLSGQNYRDEHIRLDLWPQSEPEGTPPLQ